MIKNKKLGLLESSVTIVRVVLCFLFAFIAFILIYYGIIDKAHVIDDEPLRYIENWTVSDGEGKDFEIGRSYAAQKDYENGVMATSTLPDDIKDPKAVKVIFESCGSKENPGGINKSVEALKAAGFNATGFISEGTAHEFLTWRRSLREMAPLLFK